MKKKIKNPFVKRITFRAFLTIDPANPAMASIQGIEGEIQLNELIVALGSLRDDILIRIGQQAPPPAPPAPPK